VSNINRQGIQHLLDEGLVVIENFDPNNLKTASYDVRLDFTFQRFKIFPLIKDIAKDQTKNMELLQCKYSELTVKRLQKNSGLINQLKRFWFTIEHKFWFGIDDDGLYFLMRPLGFVNGVKKEKITLSPRIGAILDGKSSTGRKAITVHITAGFADPGYSGRMTLEISNQCFQFMKLRPNITIGQLRFLDYGSDSDLPYGSESANSHYQNHDTVMAGAEVN
jgi:deoxycytidine triphosphate deaminase